MFNSAIQGCWISRGAFLCLCMSNLCNTFTSWKHILASQLEEKKLTSPNTPELKALQKRILGDVELLPIELENDKKRAVACLIADYFSIRLVSKPRKPNLKRTHINAFDWILIAVCSLVMLAAKVAAAIYYVRQWDSEHQIANFQQGVHKYK